MRFFRLPPLPSTAAPFGRPTTHAPFHSAGVAPAKRLRLQGQPLSWLLARSGLPQLPPNPQSGAAYGRILFTGASAPLLFSAPAWSPARRFYYRSAKAHRVFAPSSSPPLPTPPHMPTHKASAGGFLFGCAAARAPPPALLRSYPQSQRTSVRASQRRGRAPWRDGARRSHHSFCRKALATRFWWRVVVSRPQALFPLRF